MGGMDKFEPILRGNREALAMAAELIEIASAMPFDVKAVANFRHEMIKRVSQQVNDKGRILIDPLRNCSDPALRALAHHYTSEALKLRQYLAVHHGRWTIQAIEADPQNGDLFVSISTRTRP